MVVTQKTFSTLKTEHKRDREDGLRRLNCYREITPPDDMDAELQQYKENGPLLTAFKQRVRRRKQKGALSEEATKKLWIKILDLYKSGFYCEYCHAKMVIKGGPNAFSLEHPNNDYNPSAQEEILIISTGCNMFKRHLSKTDFQKIISSLVEIQGMEFYQRIKIELHAGLSKGLAKATANGKICHRPKKDLNIDRLIDNYKKGKELAEIAAIENISVSTVWDRLNKSGVERRTQIKTTACTPALGS